MRRTILFAFAFCFGTGLYAQTPKTNQQKMMEVYGNYWEIILQTDPMREQVLNQLLNERIEIVPSPKMEEEKYELLSSIPLNNKYNKSLEKDNGYDPNTFNPLKYNFNYFSFKDQIFRIDNSEYLLYIKGQQLSQSNKQTLK